MIVGSRKIYTSFPDAIGEEASWETGIGGDQPKYKILRFFFFFVNCLCMANEKLHNTIMFLSCHCSFV